MKKKKGKTVKCYSVRTIKDQVVIFDTELQCDENGVPRTELHFYEKKYAEELIKRLDDPWYFKVVELDISVDDICLQMTAEEVHQKALEEMNIGKA